MLPVLAPFFTLKNSPFLSQRISAFFNSRKLSQRFNMDINNYSLKLLHDDKFILAEAIKPHTNDINPFKRGCAGCVLMCCMRIDHKARINNDNLSTIIKLIDDPNVGTTYIIASNIHILKPNLQISDALYDKLLKWEELEKTPREIDRLLWALWAHPLTPQLKAKHVEQYLFDDMNHRAAIHLLTIIEDSEATVILTQLKNKPMHESLNEDEFKSLLSERQQRYPDQFASDEQ